MIWIKKKLTLEKKPLSEYIIEGVIIASSIIVSLVVAFISSKGSFDLFQTITTTMLSFICAEYIGHSILEKSKYFKAKKIYFLVELANEWTSKFYEMNEYCKEILENSHGPEDLFVLTCNNNIDNLHYILQTAAKGEKIEISSDFIVNSVGVFEALNVTNDKTVELTFPIDEMEGELLKTPEDKKFFETAYRMVQDHYIQKIKVLLILANDELKDNERLQALHAFYSGNASYECKYILKSDFINACESNMVSSSQLDFGIYGPFMLFRVEQYEPYKGIYTKNAEEVARYHKLFDEVWNFESLTHKMPDAMYKIATPSELFEKLSHISDFGKK